MRATSRRGTLAAAILLALSTAPASAAAKAPGVNPVGIRGLGPTERVIEIATLGMRTTHATARTYQRVGARWRIVRRAMPARVGVHGLSRPRFRHAGDGTTPIGNHGFV